MPTIFPMRDHPIQKGMARTVQEQSHDYEWPCPLAIFFASRWFSETMTCNIPFLNRVENEETFLHDKEMEILFLHDKEMEIGENNQGDGGWGPFVGVNISAGSLSPK